MNKNEFQNQISQFIIHDQYDQAFDYLEIYKRKFGKDTFYYFCFFNENVPIVKKRLTSYFNERTMQIVRKNKGALTRDEASRFTS